MKKIKHLPFVIIICTVLAASLAACNASPTVTDSQTETVCYNINDFQSLKIGESTFDDVYNVAPDFTMYAASYGALCEYASDTGGKIWVKLYGKELILGAIEVGF